MSGHDNSHAAHSAAEPTSVISPMNFVSFTEPNSIPPECQAAWHYLGWTTECPVEAMTELQRLIAERRDISIVQQYMIIVRTFEALAPPTNQPTNAGAPALTETTNVANTANLNTANLNTDSLDVLIDALTDESDTATSDYDPLADSYATVADDDESVTNDYDAVLNELAQTATELCDELSLAELDFPTETTDTPAECLAIDEEVASAEDVATDRNSRLEHEPTPEPVTPEPEATACQPAAPSLAIAAIVAEPSEGGGEEQLSAWRENILSEISQMFDQSATKHVMSDSGTVAADRVEVQPPSHTILAVDDSPTVRKLVSMTLEMHGYQVVTAENGLDALKVIARVTPDLILLDVNMPRMDGYKLCKMIKGHEKTRDIPVIMLTGKDGMFDKLRGKFSGCDDYMSKPFESTHLLTYVAKYLHTSQTTK